MTNTTEPPLKKCFVICPIGEDGSDARRWSDDIYKNLIVPVAFDAGFDAKRALEGSGPGEITERIVADVVEADLVIADLTFHNANVFYELCIRHREGTPYIHIAKFGTRVPFDISQTSVVWVHQDSFFGNRTTERELKKHIQAVVDQSASFDNPLKRYQRKLHAQETGDPIESRVLALEERVQRLTAARASDTESLPPFLASNPSKYAAFNEQMLDQQDRQLNGFLTSSIFNLIFNPVTGRSKKITFLPTRMIGEGQNEHEYAWRLKDGRLEIVQSDGRVHSRFVYVPSDRSFQHTNDPDTLSVANQRIVLQT